MRDDSLFIGAYDADLVVLSFVGAVLASLAALELIVRRLSARGPTRAMWRVIHSLRGAATTVLVEIPATTRSADGPRQ